MISLSEDKRVLGYESLGSYPNIFHFVTTRQGGYGVGGYGSFNCSPFSGDDPHTVRRNQDRLFEGTPYDRTCLVMPHQTHGCEIAVIDDAFAAMDNAAQTAQLEGVDALITNRHNHCLAISTADCVPLLLYDRMNKAVAAVHAGWRSTVQHIALLTLQKMQLLYGTQPLDVVACIGPSISQQAFEVGDEVYDCFLEAGYEPSISCRNSVTGKHHIDLWEANRQQLLNFGIPPNQIEVAGICTYQHHEQFFSARRLGIASGRILSGIMLVDV